MKSINKILNKPDQTLAKLTKLALLNQYYTKLVQKYLCYPLNEDTFVTKFDKGSLTIATPHNEKLTLLRYSIPDLIVKLRKDENFTGLVTIKAIMNTSPPQNLTDRNTKVNLNKTKVYLSNNAAKTLDALAAKITYQKLKDALLKLKNNTK